jgi:hypothetical protein
MQFADWLETSQTSMRVFLNPTLSDNFNINFDSNFNNNFETFGLK